MAQNERVIQLSCPATVTFELAQEAVRAIGFKVQQANASEGLIIAKKGMTLTAHGYEMGVRVQAGGPRAVNESGLSVMIATKKNVALDFGKSKKMMDDFETAIQRLLSEWSAAGVVERNKWQPSV